MNKKTRAMVRSDTSETEKTSILREIGDKKFNPEDRFGKSIGTTSFKAPHL